MKKLRYNEKLHKGIVDKLKQLRKSKGLTQEQVRFDLGELNIGRIESGHHTINIYTLSDLCDYYGVTLAEFFADIKS